MASRDEVMLDHNRRDFRDRRISSLKPHHRASWTEFRQFGMLLPFGALNAHHNAPNKLLLDLHYGWTISDDADPLESWPIKDVLASGKRHNVPR
eukprot:jgi/Mesen1/800/ME000110S_11059